MLIVSADVDVYTHIFTQTHATYMVIIMLFFLVILGFKNKL